jgi:outer membrane cobalamin receptor
LKSALYIIVTLLIIADPVYSHLYSQKDSSAVSIGAFKDSLKNAVSAPGTDSIRSKADSLKTMHADSIVIDSVRIRFIPGMGQFIPDVDTESVLYQTQFLWSDAKNIGDLTWKIPGIFYRDLGEAGKWGQLNAFGVDGRGIGILLDGRPMNDPITGAYNISDLPLELFDNIEVLSGPAAIPANVASGIALNFVSRSYNSIRPATKLRFVQDAKGTVLTDGLYTQNVARGLNLMIGVQRTVTAGRFLNADLDAWNIRTRLRYNISDRFNIALSDFYTKAGNGLNGGIDISQSPNIFDETYSYVNNKYAWDKRSRHDVTLSAIARLLPDSSSVTQASVYYSSLDREYRDPPAYFGQSQNIDDSTKASFWGLRIQQKFSIAPIHITFGGSWERRQSDSTRTLSRHTESENSIFAQAELKAIDIITPSLSFRSTSLDGENTFNTAAGLRSAAADWLTFFADISWSDRFPTMQERYWKDSTLSRAGTIQKEQHAFIQGGFNVRAGSALQINLAGFQREVKHAIIFQPAVTAYGSAAMKISNVNSVKTIGINGSLVFHWHKFEVLGVMTLSRYTQADTLKTLMPDVILSGELSYRDKLFKEKLDAKFGVRSRFYNRQMGMQFDPQSLAYSQYQTNLLGRSTTLDLFMVLKIGDAHLSLSWNNLLNAQYMFAPVYPMPGRNVRLGVNWVFLD